MSIRELHQKRAGLVSEARQIIDLADKEKRALTAEEEQRYSALMEEVSKLGDEIKRREQLETLELEMRSSASEPSRPEPNLLPGGGRGDGNASPYQFRSRGLVSLNEAGLDLRQDELWRGLFPMAEAQHRAATRNWLRLQSIRAEEERALQVDSDSQGGYLRLPMQFADRLIQGLDNLVFVRQWATVFAVPSAESLGAPSLDSDPADPTWTSEIAIGTEDSSMAFGRRELHPHPLGKFIKVSRKLLRSVPDVEGLVIQRLGYKFAVVQENGFLNGSGAGQPLGVFTASAQGISTARDVSTGNTTTSVTFDGLKEVKYSLAQQYWAGLRWVFHRDAVKQIAKLKDGNGQYIWDAASVRSGDPDRLLGVPVFMSEYAPNTFTTGLYVGIIGNFSYYWIADALGMDMQRLVELYAATNQVGFIGRLECDGMPVLESAFARVKLA